MPLLCSPLTLSIALKISASGSKTNLPQQFAGHFHREVVDAHRLVQHQTGGLFYFVQNQRTGKQS